MPFTGGPSVRVSPNTSFDIRWRADFVGNGKVEIFDTPNGGPIIVAKQTTVSGNDQTVTFSVGGVLKADATYYFKVTHTDPTGGRADLTNDPAPYPLVFTGVQAIGDVFADVDVDSAVVSWTANVIGYGSVVYGIGGLNQGPVTDKAQYPISNIPNHVFSLSGLQANTTYQYTVSNNHWFDDDALAEQSGQFMTLGNPPSGNRLTEPQARPRVIYPEDVATLSVHVRDRGRPVPNVLVHFRAINGTAGGDAISDATGKATIWMQGGTPGLLRVEASSPDTGNRVVIPVVVRLF